MYIFVRLEEEQILNNFPLILTLKKKNQLEVFDRFAPIADANRFSKELEAFNQTNDLGLFIIDTIDGKVVNIEGDPDHPVNRGGACAKGASMRQLSPENPWRLNKVLYRAPGGTDWEEKSWDWALDTIARRIKDTRDDNFIETDGGNTVNRNEAIANLGGSALDNEECYLLSKLTRALGMVYLEHHARI